MQAAVTRMIASVGSMMVGFSTSSTRTSPGACMTTARMGISHSQVSERILPFNYTVNQPIKGGPDKTGTNRDCLIGVS